MANGLNDIAEDGSGQVSPTLGLLHGLVGYRLRRASNAMAADFARTMADNGLRSVLFSILVVVSENPGINQTELGRMLGIQRANMVPLLSSVIDDDLIRRVSVPGDKRAFALHLTEHGHERLIALREKVLDHEERMLANLDTAERATLLTLLCRIADMDPDQ